MRCTGRLQAEVPLARTSAEATLSEISPFALLQMKDSTPRLRLERYCHAARPFTPMQRRPSAGRISMNPWSSIASVATRHRCTGRRRRLSRGPAPRQPAGRVVREEGGRGAGSEHHWQGPRAAGFDWTAEFPPRPGGIRRNGCREWTPAPRRVLRAGSACGSTAASKTTTWRRFPREDENQRRRYCQPRPIERQSPILNASLRQRDH